jgi:hypothetical protein
MRSSSEEKWQRQREVYPVVVQITEKQQREEANISGFCNTLKKQKSETGNPSILKKIRNRKPEFRRKKRRKPENRKSEIGAIPVLYTICN